MRLLFVFAHQDDEVAAAPRIRRAVAGGDEIACAFLTGERDSVRDDESRRALAFLSVTDVAFIGSDAGIDDGTLVENLDLALTSLAARFGGADEVWTLAWEGGHQDHDAAQLVALALARRLRAPCFEVPLYTGFGRVGPFFRVNHPIGDGWTSRKLPLRDVWKNAALTRFYRSQRRTWLALLPGLLTTRRGYVREADAARVLSRPHEGPLFYERRFRYPYSRFEAHARPFIEARLG
ncbi:MAG TPA: PIG-L family deacetylase [Thermoanaerobaculia bacterium]|jgi:LmbE family N-acetylglucosaminyl deacetylase|nr:PIG-L family deacetylase [Thermoanaerobaculia bacterium]